MLKSKKKLALEEMGSLLAGWATEKFDNDFIGQHLQTTYFDTPQFALRRP